MRAPSANLSSRAVAAGAGLVLLYVVLVFGTYRVLSSNELTTLPIAKSLLDSTVYLRDWFLRSPPLPRLPFAYLVSPLTAMWPLPTVALVLRLISWTLLVWALARIWARLGLRVTWWIPVIAVYFALGQSLFAGEWLFKWVESKVFAYAAVFFGLGWALDQRWTRSGLALGVAASTHALVGGWSIVSAVPAVVAARRALEPAWTRWGAATLAAASVGISLAVVVLFEPAPASALRDPAWIYVSFRNPHHVDPRAFDWNAVRVLGAVGLTAYAAHRAGRGPSVAARFIAAFVLASMMIAAAGVAVSFVPGGQHLLRFYPFRVGPSAGLLLGLGLIALDLQGAAERLRSGRTASRSWAALRWLPTAALVLAAIPTFVTRTSLFLEFPRGAMIGGPAESRSFYEVSAWLRDHTAPDAMLIAPPGLLEAAVLSERSMPVCFKGVPAGKAGLVEWYRRLVDFNGGVEPASRGFAASREIDARFAALPPGTFRELAQTYDGDVLLIPSRDDVELPILFRNDRWSVHALTSTATGSRPGGL